MLARSNSLRVSTARTCVPFEQADPLMADRFGHTAVHLAALYHNAIAARVPSHAPHEVTL